jgi:hypothetical protein
MPRQVRSDSSGTQALIDAALAAKDAFQNATDNANTAAQTLRDAAASVTQANQMLHDDLAANGAYASVDTTVTPPTVVLYAAVDPDTYSATPIRTS